jgi:thiamine-phosphate pyrophosphorylase
MQKIKDYSLYLVITENYCNGRSALEIARSAISSGVDIIQMREKNKPALELIDLGRKLSKLCRDSGVIFIVNDDPEIALETGAEGVHLGQEDITRTSIREARRIIGSGKIIGLSTESVSQVKEAMSDKDVDYIAYGPVFSTEVKDKCVGTGEVGKVLSISKKPVFFIGGITLSNVDELLKKRAKNISLIRAITMAGDVEFAVKSFKKKIEIACPTASESISGRRASGLRPSQ